MRIFTRWRCVTHNCGSYNFNNISRHEIDSCDIITEQTCGIIKPKTFGGYNGDVGREYIKEYRDELRCKQIEASKISKWINFVKNANRNKRVLRNKRKEDKNR